MKKQNNPANEIPQLTLLGVSKQKLAESMAEKFEVPAGETIALVDQVLAQFKAAAACDPETEKGKAIEQLNLIFFNAMKIQDYKTALAVRKELNDLLQLKTVKPKNCRVAAQLKPYKLEDMQNG